MMKRIRLYFPVFVLLILWTGCDKETTLLPPRETAEEVQAVADRYNEILISTDKWGLVYKPENYEDSVYIQLQFTEEGKVDILSGYRDFHTLQSATVYTFEGKYIPIITFADNTVFGTLADLYNGSAKFKINYIEEGEYFEFVRSDGYDNEVFRLTKMTSSDKERLTEQITAVLAQIAYEEEQARLSAEVRQKVKDFVEIESDFYFYNLTVDDFSAAINSFDTTARTISLTYKETSTSAPTDVTVGYTLTAEGIVLNPAITYGDVSIDLIELGGLKYEDPANRTAPTSIEIVSAGNAGAGVMGYVHAAPYVYTSVENRTETAAQLLYDTRIASNFMYTSNSDDYYSPEVLALREQFRQSFTAKTSDFTETRFNLQFYFRTATSSNQSLQLTARNSANSGNTFYALYLSLNEDGLGDNVLNYSLNGSVSSNVNQNEVRDEYEAFYHALFPEEGVTVVPYRVGTTTRFRLVNRTDSRIWVNYVHNLASVRSIVFN